MAAVVTFPPPEGARKSEAEQALIQAEEETLQRLEEIRAERARLYDGAGRMGPWLQYAAVLEARRAIGGRYSTGLPTLDARLDGGLYAGTLTIVQGKPGVGKTMLATQIALALGRHCAVAALFADEGMPGASIRIGQQLGIERQRLMAGDLEATRRASADLQGACPSWWFLDPSDQQATVEFLAGEFERIAPEGLQRVWLLDSAQVLRSRRTNPRADRRQTMAGLLTTIRELSLQHKSIVLVVSQVGRGAYRSKKEEDRIDPLAAGLETSSIEFMADLILDLSGDPTTEHPQVKLRCPKNRLSPTGTFEFALRMDYPRARFWEVSIDETTVEEEQARRVKEEAEEAKVLAVIRSTPGVSGNGIREGASLMRSHADAARRRLVDKKVIYFQEGGARGAIQWFAY